MEDRQLLDVKLKKLIQVCKQTLNFKKLAVVGFILQSNLIDEIGLKLAFRLRNKSSGEKVYEYMEKINEFFGSNVGIRIFNPKLIDTMKRVEVIFLAKRGDIPLELVKDLFDIYFKLRKIQIPNLQEEISLRDLSQETQLNYLSFLAKGTKPKSSNDKVKPLIIHKIAKKEEILRDVLEEEFDEENFKDLMKLQILKDSIKNTSKGKIIIKGRLSDNIVYRASRQKLIKYTFWGIFILFAMVIGIILYETILFPYLTVKLSPVLLLVILSCIIVFLLYRSNLKGR